MRRLPLILALFVLIAATRADIDGVAYQPKLGAQIPLDAALVDDDGRALSLDNALGGRPTILVLAYYRCPNLCGLVLSDLAASIDAAKLDPKTYSLVVVDIDPDETSADAAAAKARYPGAGRSWHFTTGSADAIAAIEKSAGFTAKRDPRFDQYVHPAGVVYLTPAGRIGSYELGLGYHPEKVLAPPSAEAPPWIRLLCLHYDPTTGRYSLAILRILSILAALTVLALGGFIAFGRR